MITPHELDVFQVCRARWKLAKEQGDLVQKPSDYLLALRKTIFQMYSWLLEKDRLITDRQVRDRWDKNWWAASMDRGDLGQSKILELATKGWIMLEKYWGEIYIKEPHLVPVGINIDFSVYKYDVHYRIHADLILSDKDGCFYLRQLGTKKTDWFMYNSLSTKLEILALAEALNQPPARKSHINLLSTATEIDEKTIHITPSYLNTCELVIDSISTAIKNKATYTSSNAYCQECKYKKQCWF